ncbi:MAG TPA: UDP-N-acetylmuramoyl-L-alanyl-D-glutamate--2,6-diaminopimelate ligase, partial [Leptospiraceae bacterium]|nr:UDP-N-acetylmuramoyl-L-alanyl-D-glutamate--2,6-diaminopimelate ligase [Leptospiraceae bacterium]
ISEIEKGIPSEFKNWKKISDRREAIREAVKMLPENGLLLVAGKGHENYQIIGKEKFHFLDSEEIEKAFSEE